MRGTRQAEIPSIWLLDFEVIKCKANFLDEIRFLEEHRALLGSRAGKIEKYPAVLPLGHTESQLI